MTPQALARIIASTELSEEQLARLLAAFDESKHVRYPAGDPRGGQFAPKGVAPDTGNEQEFLERIVANEFLPLDTDQPDPYDEKDATAWNKNALAVQRLIKGEAVKLSGSGLGEGDNYEDREQVKREIAEAIGKRMLENEPELADDLAALTSKFGQPWGKGGVGYKQSTPLADFAASRVSTWASTSGDSHPGAIALQHAIAEEMGLDPQGARLKHFEKPAYGSGEDYSKRDKIYHHGLRPSFKNGDGPSINDEDAARFARLSRGFVRAQYENTQDTLKRLGIKELYLYRGVKTYASTADNAGPHFTNAVLQPASSFSTKFSTASSFGGGDDIVLLAKVPASRILGCSVTGYGCRREEEFVVLGGKLPVVRTRKIKVANIGDAVRHAIKTRKTPVPAKPLFDTSDLDETKTLDKEGLKTVKFALIARDPLYPDDDLENADWTKRSWDLPFAFGSDEYLAWIAEDQSRASLPVVLWAERSDEKVYAETGRDYAPLVAALNAQEDEALREVSQAIIDSRNASLKYIRANFARLGEPEWLDKMDLRAWDTVEASLGETLRQAWEQGRRYVRGALPSVRTLAQATSFAPKESLKWLRSKQLYVSGVTREDLLKRAKNIILQGLKKGEDEEVLMGKLFEAWVPHVGNGVDLETMGRLRTIIRTNSTEALNEGILAEARNPDVMKYIKALEYVATLDERTTPVCELLHGTQIWPDDPRLDSLVPPSHFNCRSILDPVIMDEEYDPENALLTPELYAQAVAMIAPGFGGEKAVNTPGAPDAPLFKPEPKAKAKRTKK